MRLFFRDYVKGTPGIKLTERAVPKFLHSTPSHGIQCYPPQYFPKPKQPKNKDNEARYSKLDSRVLECEVVNKPALAHLRKETGVT